MAVIRGIDFVPVFTDIKQVSANAFAQTSGGWHFGYVNMNNVAVVMSSTDEGKTWSQTNSYSPATYITVTASWDDDLIACVTSQQTDRTVVYKNGEQMLIGVGGAETVCIWPYVIVLTNANGGGSLLHYVAGGSGSWDGIVSTATLPTVYAVLGYGNDSTSVNLACATGFDPGIGWTGGAATQISDINPAPSDANNPSSQLVLKYKSSAFAGGGSDGRWVGFNSSTYSGFFNFPDFAGVSAGGASPFISDLSNQRLRGTFFGGYATQAPPVVCDRGLSGPHKTAFGCVVDGETLAFFVDQFGLMGSSVNSVFDATADAGGDVTGFDKGKIYGNTDLRIANLSYGAGIQSGSFSVFLLSFLNRINFGDAMTLYRLTDPQPLNRPHAFNTELYSQTTTATQGLPVSRDPFQINTDSNAIGVTRTTTTSATYGIPLLIEACTSTAILANPNGSPGCSPILRELLNESGVAYSITREMANDQDPNSHQGGNALDLAGPSSPIVLVGASVTDEASQQMGEIVAWLRQVPELFACVIHYDPITPSNSLYIWDGRIVTASQFGGVTSQAVKDSISNIHVSSSKTRLLRGFQNPKIVAALGLTTPYTDPVTGQTTVQQVTDPFTSDRYVYVNSDGYAGSSQTTGLAAGTQAAYTVNFW